jgi:VanZ family protein
MIFEKTPFTIRLLLPILWYGLIFYITEQPEASSLSTQLIMFELYDTINDSVQLANIWILRPEFWNGVLRIGSHLFMFGNLGILFYHLIEPSLRFNKKTFLISILLVTLFGISDEVHQSFVPGRFPMPIDVLKDIAGAIVFILLACKIVKHKTSNFTSKGSL